MARTRRRMENSMVLTMFSVVLLIQGCSCKLRPRADLIVSKAGDGNFRSITEAVANIPNVGSTRFAIYIKAGAYEENLVEISQRNVVLYGDGMGKTRIRTKRSGEGGFSIFKSPALAVRGANFIGMDMTFENYAGPSQGQAVAFMSESDRSALYRCEFLGYQDTLLASSGRQFYKDCVVEGTLDFIFGNAAAVFQDCAIRIRPLPGTPSFNSITAQARKAEGERTGFALQGCTIGGARGIGRRRGRGFLGRPWFRTSTTMVMESFISDVIDPRGWLDWEERIDLRTVTFREFNNTGPGSSTRGRVRKAGYRLVTDPEEAKQFTVARLINGEQWLSATNIPFYPSLKYE